MALGKSGEQGFRFFGVVGKHLVMCNQLGEVCNDVVAGWWLFWVDLTIVLKAGMLWSIDISLVGVILADVICAKPRIVMESNSRNAMLSAFLGLVILPTTACDKPAKPPLKELLSFKGRAADVCSATRFSDFNNLRQVDHNSADPIINAAWVAGADAVEKQRDIFIEDYCSFEVLASPNQERCFHFHMKKLATGGAIQLCIDSDRKVSRVYLDE